MEISTHIYQANDLENLRNIPEWVFESINQSIYGAGGRLVEEFPIFIQDIFGQDLNLQDEVSALTRRQLDPLVTLLREQRKYLFDLREGESKDQVLSRHLRIENLLNESYRNEDECNIWFVGATINQQPYGGVFVFQHLGSPDLMIQGISKFMTFGVLSIISPDLASKLPKLNSILLPAIETIGQNTGAERIIVNPIGIQGRILETYYGFYPIDPLTPVCSNIMESCGDFQWYAKDLFRDNQQEG